MKRIVVVAAGFGLWHDNRHMASARWGDVAGVRFAGRDDAASNRVCVISLRDSAEVSIENDASGYESFLVAARAALPDMHWHDTANP